jgi:hypothetical protein
MPDDLVIELVDGAHLVLDGAEVTPHVRRELEVWGLVPADRDAAEARRDPSVWHDALQAGPLLYVVFAGVVGNAAWEVFPASARYLTLLFKRRRTLDAAAVARRAREAAAAVAECDPDAVHASAATRNGQGVWHVRLALDDGRSGTARLEASGNVTT